MYLWNTDRLALALAKNELTTEQKFRYLLLLQVIYPAAGYLGWLFVVTSPENIFWFEGLMIVVVTYFGIRRCRDRYASAPQNRFIEDCMILQVPLALKYFGIVWLSHYVVRQLFEVLVPLIQVESESSAKMFDFILRLFYNINPFVIVLIATAWFYLRLSHHMESIANAQPA